MSGSREDTERSGVATVTDQSVLGFVRQYVEARPVYVQGAPDAQNVFLKVGHQSFCVTKYAADDGETAAWFCDQLCIALARIIHDARALSVVDRKDSSEPS
jgi:hypothetical protein